MKLKVIYWFTTVILASIFISGGVWYLYDIPGVQKMISGNGYPAYLVPYLGVAMLAGGVTILWRYSVRLSDLAYAGMFYQLVLALGVHIESGDGGFVPAVVGLTALFISFATQNAARKKPSPYLV